MENICQWEKDLREIISRGQDIFVNYQEYSKCYPFTNERLSDLMYLLNTSGVYNALCVLSSGDHVFNLISKGIINIDTFDTNRLTEYYALGFKKTALQNLKYQEFCDYFFGPHYQREKTKPIENYVIEHMPQQYRAFWQGYINNLEERKKDNKGIFELLTFLGFDTAIEYNKYLSSEIEYNNLQKNLEKANISFSPINIKKVWHSMGKYDLILLSNVIQAMRKPLFGKAINIADKIYKHNLNENGEMIYLYEFVDPDFFRKDEVILARTLKGNDIKYLLNGSYATGKKKVAIR
ncbi:MAG: DUF3419 family protein [Bacilli bacterium]|nr:DUF3419 family protein [Bacilli bacterium]